jgi:hypothetical protein
MPIDTLGVDEFVYAFLKQKCLIKPKQTAKAMTNND